MTDGEQADVIRIDDLVVDEDSGEVLEWPAGVVDRVEYLQAQQLLGKQLEEDGKAIRATAGRALYRLLDASYSSDAGRTTVVRPGTTRKAHAANVVTARMLELLTDSQVGDLLVLAAKELDRAQVEAWVDSQEVDDDTRAKLRGVLITETPRAGYAYTQRARVKAPRVTREAGGDA